MGKHKNNGAFNRRSNIKNHARQRIQERLNFTPNKEDFKNMISLIQNKGATLEYRTSLRVGVYRMCYNGHEFLAAYDRQRKLIVTVLFPRIEDESD